MIGHLSSHKKPIVIASMGRCGSSMIFRSLSRSTLKLKTGIQKIDNRVAEAVRRPAWNLKNKEFKKGMVYKTHDYPNKIKGKTISRFLYLYGCPYQVVVSTIRKTRERGDGWLKRHSKRLKSPVNSWEELINKDALNLEKHFDKWENAESRNCLLVHYENIWKHKNLISDHIGVDIKIPEQRERKSSLGDLKKQKMKKIKSVYKNLKNKVEKKKR